MGARSRRRINARTRAFALAMPLAAVTAAVISAFSTGGCISSPSADPPPPQGGQRYVMDYDTFASEIDSILTAEGCDNLTCHGGGIRGTFELSPSTANDVDMDYQQASLQVTGSDPTSSPLLLKPLAEAAGGVAHAGSVQSGFADTDDPAYQAILAWIEGGHYE